MAAEGAPETRASAQDRTAAFGLALERQLEHPHPEVRLEAAAALGRLGAKALAPHCAALASRADDGDARVRKKVTWALQQAGAAGADALAARLHHRDAEVRRLCAAALGHIGASSAAGAVSNVHAARLAGRLMDPDLCVRQGAAGALAQLPSELGAAHAGSIVGRLDDQEGEVRRGAAHALARMGPAAAAHTPDVAQWCWSEDERHPAIKAKVSEALWRMGEGPQRRCPLAGTAGRLYGLTARTQPPALISPRLTLTRSKGPWHARLSPTSD